MLEDYKTAIDIGSNKIVAVISEYDSVVKDLRICGYSEVESDGVRNGIVVNIDVLSNKIAKAIEEVEKMAGREVRNIIINASGKHINVIQSEGIHAVENQGYEITYNDICKVLETAKAVKMNPDSSILNIFPIEYKIDGQGGIIMPLNMVGVRLEVKVNIITGDNRAMHNLIKSINSLNLQVDDYIFSGIASANAVLTEEEKEHGVLLMDIGAGTIDVIGYENNSVFCVDSFDKGGEDVNIEIAKNFNTSLKEADRLKKEYGYALLNLCNADETIQINILGNAKKVIIKRCELVLVIENTLRKIFKEVLKKIENHDLKNRCVAGIVLTGGSAELKGIAELLEEITELPVRIGYPILKNNNKIMRQSKYATSIGLLRYIFENEELKYLEYSPRRYDNFMGWVKDLVAQIF